MRLHEPELALRTFQIVTEIVSAKWTRNSCVMSLKRTFALLAERKRGYRENNRRNHHPRHYSYGLGADFDVWGVLLTRFAPQSRSYCQKCQRTQLLKTRHTHIPFMHTHTQTHTHTHTQTHTHTDTHRQITYMHGTMHAYMHTHTYIYIDMCIYIYIRTLQLLNLLPKGSPTKMHICSALDFITHDTCASADLANCSRTRIACSLITVGYD